MRFKRTLVVVVKSSILAIVLFGSALSKGDDGNNAKRIPRDTLTVVLGCNAENSRFGESVSSAGDVNGDGYEDIIVGEPDYLSQGRTLVYFGTPVGMPSAPDWWANGSQYGAHFGYSVACAGDVNGDGYDDVIVGMPDDDVGGHAYVYHGDSTGLKTSASWARAGGQAGARFGYSVSSAGDVNGDGYDDVIVGAPNYYFRYQSTVYHGRVVIYLGGSSGLSSSPSWSVGEYHYFYPSPPPTYFSYSVSNAGDVNGDGYDDVIVGSPYFDAGQTDEGRVYAFYGDSLGPSSTADWHADGNQTHGYFGSSVSYAGDLDRNGFDDIIVGAPN